MSAYHYLGLLIAAVGAVFAILGTIAYFGLFNLPATLGEALTPEVYIGLGIILVVAGLVVAAVFEDEP